MSTGSYVLITPAKNEERYIEGVLLSVTRQSLLPMEWVIVSDGSTDRTDEIVDGYAKEHRYVRLLRRTDNSGYDFGSKALAFSSGYDDLRTDKFDYVGNLDADVSFGPLYFERLIERMDAGPQIGIGGGIIVERVGNVYVRQNISLNSVAGAVQLFRYACYQDIGGYRAIRCGGIDAAAEIMAMTKGWKVETFPELEVEHHRRVTRSGSLLKARFRQGEMHYALGYRPLFELARMTYRVSELPRVLGSVFSILGYLYACMRIRPRVLPSSVVLHLKKQQSGRLRRFAVHRSASGRA